MANDADWYEVIRDSELVQGDLLSGCPVPRVRGFDHGLCRWVNQSKSRSISKTL